MHQMLNKMMNNSKKMTVKLMMIRNHNNKNLKSPKSKNLMIKKSKNKLNQQTKKTNKMMIDKFILFNFD
jgi:hypothetical protein